MAVDFSQLFDTLKDELFALSKETLKGYVKAAKKDTTDYLEKSKERLEKWCLQLASGELSKDDFEYNLKSQKDLLIMVSLKQAGLAKVKLDKFKDDLFNTISATLLKAVGL